MAPCVVDDGTDPLLHEWAVNCGLLLVRENSGVRVYRGCGALKFSVEQIEWLRSRGFERPFEHCYLPSHIKGMSRSRIVHALFDEMGGAAYSAGITSNTNVGCYDLLLSGAYSRLRSDLTRVLDVGCGPGTILGSISANQATTLMGFDFVEANSVEARMRGLPTISAQQVASMSDAFDILVSSYVLHFEALSDDIISHLARALRMGGIWAANFHKSMGLDWFAEALTSRGGFTMEVEESPYGKALFARKTIE
jgi:hypothetical protein